MTTLRVRFPYKEWPGWDVPECTLTCVQLPNAAADGVVPARKVITVNVDAETQSDYSSDSPVFRATLADSPTPLVSATGAGGVGGGGARKPACVALKFALREDLVADLAEEACAYTGVLKPLQGTTVPRCHGLYAGTRDDGQMIACLVLEYWGQCLHQPFKKLPLSIKWVFSPSRLARPISSSLPFTSSFHLLTHTHTHTHIHTHGTHQRIRVLHQLGQLHRQGLLHGDFAERNVLEMNGDIRIIDFDQLKDHDCRCDMDFRPGGRAPDVSEFGCPYLWELCRYDMKIWDLAA
ncbi:hypothetical protein AX17_002211 [Amanita inopinata Kibby_2008]|nr:hypothetical protein AX17_002211 [Amanita inopinata Kibby_2008]